MPNAFVHADSSESPVPIIPLTPATLSDFIETPWVQAWLDTNNFKAKPGQLCLLPDIETGELSQVLVGVDSKKSLWSLAGLPAKLPPGEYQLWDQENLLDAEQAALGWGLACYRFDRYKTQPVQQVALALETHLLQRLQETVETIGWVRDLINTPAEDLGPDALADEAANFAADVGAQCQIIVGDALLEANYPSIHMVGRAATNAPRLIDLRWGDASHPKVTLVGKGITFDSGGLDIKSDAGMLLMKKDMGGAAHALGLAKMIIDQQLPVCLRVLIAAAENAIAGNAFRPGDVLTTRKGLTVEIGNTDAEGRLVLCDALAEASTEQPEMIIDFATLTGAARVALGPDVPALYSNRPEVAARWMELGQEQLDPIWHMPLVAEYRELLDSSIADINNMAKGPYAGSITAALFLQEFVDATIDWVHIDVMAWNTKTKPGRPEGGEAMGIRTALAYLVERYAS